MYAYTKFVDVSLYIISKPSLCIFYNLYIFLDYKLFIPNPQTGNYD